MAEISNEETASMTRRAVQSAWAFPAVDINLSSWLFGDVLLSLVELSSTHVWHVATESSSGVGQSVVAGAHGVASPAH
eukprot:CAMPEP_0119324186 /NCGR_PEP_ID=MMETSP1333-20130426/62544_1 /TAXON_ID=418940 /ORGANISM="Scyphosphaera apsteinii, Strain RCC1455" /LENGTH=77 /DNA_ID=CAMNT_0007331827 /DNA_START=98 /DNA_END=328 /DNA_ORIENTATION=-